MNPPLRIFASSFSAVALIDDLFGLLDERQHVAHAEHARHKSIGVERLEVLELFAAADKRDRHADDRHHRKRRAAARVAVDLRQDHAGDADLRVELARALDRVLPGHRVGDVKQIRRPRDFLDRDELLHQLVVDVQAARGIDDHDVVADRPRFGQRALRARDRIHFTGRVVHAHTGLRRHNTQLLDRRRAPHVGGHDDRVASLLCEPLGELAGRRGLARALQPEHQDHARPVRRFLQPALRIAEQREQLIANDLDDLLATESGSSGPRHPSPDRARDRRRP